MSNEKSRAAGASLNPTSETSAGAPADGGIIWLTGLSGAGKSTIATALKDRLQADGQRPFILDGDIMRRGLCSDLGFSPADRQENVRRLSEVARLFAEAGLTCVVALISPYQADRAAARAIAGSRRFLEVYVNAPLAVCEGRDPKGLYARARAGLIPEFTGINAPYQPPAAPDVEIQTDRMTPGEAVEKILAVWRRRLDQTG